VQSRRKIDRPGRAADYCVQQMRARIWVVVAVAVACLVAGYLVYPVLNPRRHPLGGCVHNATTGAISCSADALGRPTLPAKQDCSLDDVHRFAGEALCSWYLKPLKSDP